MVVMKKKKAIIAVLVIAFITSYILCGTGQNDADIDSMLKTEDIHPPKTGISVHFSGSLV